ncbi:MULTISPECIES: hypothetical protein [Alteromonas]|uniref:Uncharacterized protein n=1 Tax=Alteromonas stellipolaris TaxID=233316 RepID=A0AAW7Z1M0_9ALTE|nr:MULTISPECIES: hypothetical protein [Alteromonas]AMJ85177.1 hypothetical protein AV939_00405 [Alteromonas sp. Mac1]AMJ89063.1 hypothetical protein AV940_00405 [Alteromonas sp. Mac2]MDO6577625.1 hypothetical protein [Alteromonas stellipolaris]
MLIIFQFSYTDSRRFLSQENSWLKKPSWPTPQNKHFIRYGGPTVKRLKGGANNIGEGTICSVNNTISFPRPPFISLAEADAPSKKKIIKCRRVFSRFYFDGLCSGKYEIGLRPELGKCVSLQTSSINSILDELLNTICSVKSTSKSKVEYKVGELEDALSFHYRLATTPNSWITENEIPNWWTIKGTPLIYIETEARDKLLIKSNGLNVPIYNNTIFFRQLWKKYANNKHFRVWHRHANSRLSVEELDRARKLRMILMRLHSDREALNSLLGNISEGHLRPQAKTPETDNLQLFISTAVSRIVRDEERVGSLSEELFSAVIETYEALSPGETDEVLQKIKLELNFRPQAFKKLNKLLNREAKKVRKTIVNKTQNFNINENYGIVNIEGKISHIFNEIGKINTNKTDAVEVKQLISKLASYVSEVSEKHADPDLVENLERVVAEVNTTNPKKEILNISFDGLIEAAQKIKDLGVPIISVVTQLKQVLIG